MNKEFIAVPLMLIQPLLENSIEHGFKNLGRKGKINIKIRKQDDKLMFIVEDNGTGLVEKDTDKKNPHKSTALDIIRQRLRILNKDKSGKYGIKIENIIDKTGKIQVVKIIFYVPVKYLE